MLRLGCCTGSFSGPGDPVGRRILPKLKEAGYDYAELPLFAVMELDEAEFTALVDEVRACGVPAEACNSFFPGSLRLTGPDRDPAAITAYIKEAFRRIGALGVKRVVFGSAGAKNVPQGYDYGKAFDEIVAVLKEAGPLADAVDCTIAIEPLNHGEANIIFTTADGALLAQAADHPRVRLLVDYYHYVLEGDRLVPPTAALLCHCHFADPEGRRYPREWKPEFAAFTAELERWGYQERMSIEANPERGEEDLFAYPRLVRGEGK